MCARAYVTFVRLVWKKTPQTQTQRFAIRERIPMRKLQIDASTLNPMNRSESPPTSLHGTVRELETYCRNQAIRYVFPWRKSGFRLKTMTPFNLLARCTTRIDAKLKTVKLGNVHFAFYSPTLDFKRWGHRVPAGISPKNDRRPSVRPSAGCSEAIRIRHEHWLEIGRGNIF